MSRYQPPCTITPKIVHLIADISELIGRWSVASDEQLSPQLRRGNRIRTIQASLAIENNTLSVEQVTAILDGKRVLGLPREIQEVRNANDAYEQLPQWQMTSRTDLLSAHGLLMVGLIDDAGQLRSGGVGIYRGDTLIHMAPPANRLDPLIDDLMHWLDSTTMHPLLASCIFHYEFEFIHPFADGNGRMGRLWQTLILSQWKPTLAWLPVETVIRDQQEAYYAALAESDRVSEATPFVVFMLGALHAAMLEVTTTTVKTTKTAAKTAAKTAEKIIQLLIKEPTLAARDLAEQLGFSPRAIENNIAQLKKAGRLIRIGAAKGGHWQVVGQAQDQNKDDQQ
jgi:Fic family protein